MRNQKKKSSPSFDRETLLKMAEALAFAADVGSDKKAVGTSPTGFTLHGPGGIFSTFGLEREIITAHISSEGLAAKLPLSPSMSTDPRYGTITGVSGPSGTQPDNACEDAPTAYMKGCNLTGRFGRIRYDTNTIEFDEVIRRLNRGDFMDLQLLGSLIGDESLAGGIIPPNISEDQILEIVTLAEMMVVGVNTERELTRQLWQGNVNLNNEFPGLDSQITTGILDADIQGRLCPALDSDVRDFDFADVCGSTRDIAEYLAGMMWYLSFNARRMSLTPVEWAIVMTPTLWFELSACWPCRYLTNRCRDSSNTQVAVINDELNVSLRDRMREEMYIPINGINYPVIVDDGIFENNVTTNGNLQPGQYASSIYAVPLTILGGFPVTYREYLDYRSSVALANTAPFSQYRRDFWSDRGVFSWAYDGILWCYKLGLKTEQRVILRAPQLAGRIDNVMYEPGKHLRDSDPNSEYWFDGGVSERPTARTTYAVWSSAANNVVPG